MHFLYFLGVINVFLVLQLYMQKFQLKGERFGGGGGYFGRGRWGGFRGGFRGGLSRQGDTCYKCGGTGHWAIDCKGRGDAGTTITIIKCISHLVVTPSECSRQSLVPSTRQSHPQ